MKLKKLTSILFVVCLLGYSSNAAAQSARAFNCLTGGTSGCLDSISDADISDDAVAWTILNGFVYFHQYNASGTAAESSPSVIRPDDYDTGVWELAAVVTTTEAFGAGWDGDSGAAAKSDIYTHLNSLVVKQSDCSTITAGMCMDTDDGKLYCYDSDSVELCASLMAAGDYADGSIQTADIGDAQVTAAKLAATLDLSGKTLTLGNPLYDLTPDTDDTWQGPKSSVTAGESITQWDTIYIKYDTDGPRAFAYNANSTDSDNDTYPPVGIALESDTAGNALSFGFGKGVARNDGWSFTHAQDEGKPVYCSESAAGGIELTAPADTGDHVIRIGTIVEVDNSDNGDVILFNFGFADVTVP